MRLRNSRRLLLDTCSVIYFLKDLRPYSELLIPIFERVQSGQMTMVLSVITESELLVSPYRDDDTEAVERIGDLLSENGIEVIEVDSGIARLAARLRASHKPLRLPDATIIATALKTRCDVIVGNDVLWSKVRDVPYVHLDDVIKK